MVDGDLLSVGGELGKEIREPLTQLQLAAFGKNQDGHRRELLRDRRETEVGVRGAGCFRDQVREAIALGKNRFTFVDDHHTRAGRVGVIEVFEQGVQARGLRGIEGKGGFGRDSHGEAG